MRRATLAIVLIAVVLIGAIPAPVAAQELAGGDRRAPSGGFVGIPDSGVKYDVPDRARDLAPNASDLRGSVMASRHADTLEVTISTVGRSRADQSRSSTARDQLALIFTDDVNHGGRWVAVPATAIEDKLGYSPTTAYGVHSSGESWSAPITREAGSLKFYIPEFSSNTVTFSGTISISGKPATDGTQYTYELADVDAATDPTINFTGALAEEWDNESGTITGGGSASISVAGSVDPSGPANGNPRLNVTPKADTEQVLNPASSSGNFEYNHSASVGTRITKLRIHQESTEQCGYFQEYDVYLVEEGADGVYSEGTQIKDNWGFTSQCSPQWVTVANLNHTVTANENGKIAFEFVAVNVVDNIDVSRSEVDREPSSLSVSADDGTSHDYGDVSGQEAAEFPLTTSATSIDLDQTGDGKIDYDLQLQEQSKTTDPAIEVNGVWYNHTGTLNDGEKVTLNGSQDDIKSGTNRINISLGSVSADAPTPVVDLEYSHESVDNQSVSYTAEAWSERYNVSRTYSSNQSDPTVSIPFAGTVVQIRDVAYRIDGGGWVDLAPTSYSLDGTTLEADLPDVSAGETVTVRANGSKVQVANGQIRVDDPTPSGSSLDTEFTVVERHPGFYVDVSGTPSAAFVHYLTNASYASPSAYVIVESNGDQRLYLPQSSNGSTARVSTIDLQALPESGDVSIEVESAGAEPQIKVTEGNDPDDAITYRWHDTVSGTTYELFSVSEGVLRDSAEAESPVDLVDDDSAETLVIQESESTASGGGGGGSGVVLGPVAASSSPLDSVPVILIAALLGLLGVALVLRRYTRTPQLVIGGTAVAAVVALVIVGESISPGVLLEPIGTNLAQVAPVTGIVFTLIAAYYLYVRFIRGQTTVIEVAGRRKK